MTSSAEAAPPPLLPELRPDSGREGRGEVRAAADGALVLPELDAAAACGRGLLPAAPRADACKHCDYQPVCGPYEEERVERKSQTELRPLKDLRRMA